MPLVSVIVDTAMVFAAGFGKRMLPITNTIPKPMVKVKGKHLIDYALDSLAFYGIKKVIVNTHHLPEVIEGYLQKKDYEPEIVISREAEILETGGAIVRVLPTLGNKPFLTINSDVIILDGERSFIKNMVEAWNPKIMDVLMLVVPKEKAFGYSGNGDFNITINGEVQLPKVEESDYVFTGAMIIKPEIFEHESERSFSIFRDFIKPRYLNDINVLSKVHAITHDGKWLHIGTPESIEESERELSKCAYSAS